MGIIVVTILCGIYFIDFGLSILVFLKRIIKELRGKQNIISRKLFNDLYAVHFIGNIFSNTQTILKSLKKKIYDPK